MKNLTRSGTAVSGFLVHINQSFLFQKSNAKLLDQLGIKLWVKQPFAAHVEIVAINKGIERQRYLGTH